MKPSKIRNALGHWSEYPSSLLDWHDWEENFLKFSPVTVLKKIDVTTPSINVKETDTAFTVEVAASGMEKKDFNSFEEDSKLK